MSAYIKLTTLAYPRHIGDVEFDPDGMADYAHVEWRDPPEFDKATQLCGETAPVQEDGVWHMVWSVRDMTNEEILNKQNSVKAQWAENGFASWVFNEALCEFQPPTPYPIDNKKYRWDEPTVSWIEIL